jgi:hypothetical protein
MNTTQNADTDRSLEIANEILRQLGNMTFAMLGANQLVATESGLQFAIKGSKRVRKLVIELDQATDTYSVEGFKRKSAFEWPSTGKVEGVFVDQLHATIEQMTGLYTRL